VRPSRFTDEDILSALAQVEAGKPATHVCRALGITETTFYRWRKRLGGATAAQGKEVRSLREENRKLKDLVARLLLEKG
jgi:putative transposase